MTCKHCGGEHHHTAPCNADGSRPAVGMAYIPVTASDWDEVARRHDRASHGIFVTAAWRQERARRDQAQHIADAIRTYRTMFPEAPDAS